MCSGVVPGGPPFGSFCGLAFIGPHPLGRQNIYIATGDSGHGMTHGTIAGMLLRDLIMGRHNPWAGLYDPSRITLRAFRDLASENINVGAQFVDWVKVHFAPDTHRWYKDRLDVFLNAVPDGLTVGELKPFHVQQWIDAMPQYGPGHPALVADLRAGLPPTLAVAGGYLDGIGVPACVAAATRAAAALVTSRVAR